MSIDRRWIALYVLCLGELMIVLDTTIVNVALPSIATDLHFTETALVWVVNAYMLTYGGFLLLGGRLGDLYGQRRLFIYGIAFFTIASLACGLADSQTLLVVARAVQGLGGAVVSAVALSLIMNTFTEPAERAKAMGVYGFVCAGGGSIGVLLGGLLTDSLSWHSVFLVNLPVGIVLWLFSIRLLDEGRPVAQPDDVRRAAQSKELGEGARSGGQSGAAGEDGARLDVGGALTITASLMLAVYAIVNGNEAGWLSGYTLGPLVAAAVLFAVFIVIQRRVSHPLVPLALFASRNLRVANVVAVLFAVSMFAWFFILALYMQRVLGYSALQVGLAFLPSNIIMAVFSLGVSAWLVNRFGLRLPLAVGMAMLALGLASFAIIPPREVGFMLHLMPGMVMLGIGCGIGLNPVLLAAMSGVHERQSGLASGLVSTSFMMGGALGLALLASLADARTGALAAQGLDPTEALAGGYRAAMAASAVIAAAAAVIGWRIEPALSTPKP